MRACQVVSALCIAFALASVHLVAAEQPKKDPQKERLEQMRKDREDAVAKLLLECRQALADGDRARAASLATQACRNDSKNREAVLLQLFTTEAANLLSPPDAAAWEKLQKQKVSCDFVEVPLGCAVTFLEQITNLTMIVEPEAAKSKRRADITFTLKMTDAPVSQALDAMTRQAGLTFAVENGAIVIRADDQARAMNPPPCTVRNCMVDLLDFPDVAKPGLTGYAFSAPTSALCSNDDQLILKIKGRLPAPDAGDAAAVEARRKYYRNAAAPEWLPAVGKTLSQKVSFDFVETPLRDCVTFLQQITNQNIVLDQKEPFGGGDAEVTLKVTDMPLHEALGWIASQAGIAIVVRSNYIFVTSKERAAAEQEPGQYEFSRADAELVSRELKTQYAGLILRDPRMGTFFAVLNDANGKKLQLKGMVE